jgi:hypothetical protein
MRLTPSGRRATTRSWPNQAANSLRQRATIAASSSADSPTIVQESRCCPAGAYSGATLLIWTASLMKASALAFSSSRRSG